MPSRRTTEAELRAVLGAGYDRFTENIPIGISRVPDVSRLKIGDVLLTGYRSWLRPDLVRTWQRRWIGMKRVDAKWSHCMVYLGDGLVAETNPASSDPDGTIVEARVRERPLSAFAAEFDLKVCRLSDTVFDTRARAEAASYAREMIEGPPLPYSYGRILETVLGRKLPQSIAGGLICTDFTLQVLALGGGQLPRLYAYHDKNARGLLPGDFSRRRFFERFELGWCVLDRDQPVPLVAPDSSNANGRQLPPVA